MKCVTAVGILTAVCLQNVLAHNQFSKLVIDGHASPDYKFVRNSDYEPDPDSAPIDRLRPYVTTSQEMIETTNMTCGKNAFDYAQYTRTATVKAGSTIGFQTWTCCGLDGGIWHPGPAQMYMTRAPDGTSLEQIPGWDSEWFKVAYFGPISETEWYAQGKERLLFQLPITTPPGKYLLRLEHWMPLPGVYSQWYINCAHIEVVGPGGGKPEQFGTVKFPGSYQFSHPGITLPANVWDTDTHGTDGSTIFMNLTRYSPPGPQVWKGE